MYEFLVHTFIQARPTLAGSVVCSPMSERCDPSAKVFGVQTNDWAEAMACLRVLQHVPQSKDLHVHTEGGSVMR